MWLNWYLCQWDLFLNSSEQIKILSDIAKKINTNNTNTLLFKKINQNSYIYYRHITQILDAVLTDYNHLKYPKRHLIASLIFLIFCRFYEIPFTIKKTSNAINEKFLMDLFYCKEYEIYFKNIFREFLEQSFNLIFEDIVDCCIYCCRYLFFDFNYDYPLIIKAKKDNLENVKFIIF